jgi:tRNA threonylcarbamoyladenosine biosynthesis protein TsaE
VAKPVFLCVSSVAYLWLMKVVLTNSPEATAALGEAWAHEARPGWTIALCGDLGAGKTQLVKGLARGLGIIGRIASPTFALVNEHTSGRVPLFHLDLYRLDTRAQIAGAGLDEYFFTPRGVTVVEWAERWWGHEHSAFSFEPSASAARLRWVKIVAPTETTRRIEYEDFGA